LVLIDGGKSEKIARAYEAYARVIERKSKHIDEQENAMCWFFTMMMNAVFYE
jgi:hypothetical protein